MNSETSPFHDFLAARSAASDAPDATGSRPAPPPADGDPLEQLTAVVGELAAAQGRVLDLLELLIAALDDLLTAQGDQGAGTEDGRAQLEARAGALAEPDGDGTAGGRAVRAEAAQARRRRRGAGAGASEVRTEARVASEEASELRRASRRILDAAPEPLRRDEPSPDGAA